MSVNESMGPVELETTLLHEVGEELIGSALALLPEGTISFDSGRSVGDPSLMDSPEEAALLVGNMLSDRQTIQAIVCGVLCEIRPIPDGEIQDPMGPDGGDREPRNPGPGTMPSAPAMAIVPAFI